MNYQIDAASKEPAYLQLYRMLRKDIVEKVYRLGEKLSSKRTISAETGVSLITVQHSLELLCDEGYLEARERSGYFVAYRTEDFYDRPTPQVTALPSMEPLAIGAGAFSYDMLTKTMRRVLQDYGEKLLARTDPQGAWELRVELASYMARNRGMRVDPAQIIVGAGAEYLYSLLGQLFPTQSVIAVEDPGYEKIAKVYTVTEHCVDYLKMGADGILSSELERTRASILHVTPFHSYPSGVNASSSKKQEYLRWAKPDRYIIEDNYDSELTVSSRMEDPLYSLDEGQHVIYLNTFSKTIAPSIRVGYMVLPEALLQEYQKKLGFYACTVPAFEQYLIAELMRNGEFERHLNRVRRNLRKQIK